MSKKKPAVPPTQAKPKPKAETNGHGEVTHAMIPLAGANAILDYLKSRPWEEVRGLPEVLVGAQAVSVTPKAPDEVAAA